MNDNPTLASEIIAEKRTQARRWRTAFFIGTAVWLCTLAAIILYFVT